MNFFNYFLKKFTKNQCYIILTLFILFIILIFYYEYLSFYNKKYFNENFCVELPQFKGLTVNNFKEFLKEYQIDIPCDVYMRNLYNKNKNFNLNNVI